MSQPAENYIAYRNDRLSTSRLRNSQLPYARTDLLLAQRLITGADCIRLGAGNAPYTNRAIALIHWRTTSGNVGTDVEKECSQDALSVHEQQELRIVISRSFHETRCYGSNSQGGRAFDASLV
jgi:hypothetical protein